MPSSIRIRKAASESWLCVLVESIEESVYAEGEEADDEYGVGEEERS